MEKVEFRRPSFREGRLKRVYAVEFWEVSPGASQAAVILSNRIEWYEFHWFGGQHVPCLLGANLCVPCARGIPSLPHGYCIVLVEGQDRPKILHLTARMFADELYFQRCLDLRGTRVVMWKPGQSVRGRRNLKIEGVHPDPTKLPQTLDTDALIKKIFEKLPDPVAVAPKGVPQ